MSPRSACPSPLELTRMFSEGSGDTPWSHVYDCAECSAQHLEFLRLRALARALPNAPPSFERREQVRTELLSRVGGVRQGRARRRRAQWRVAASFGLAAMSLSVVVALRMRASNEHVYRAVARGDANARFEHRGAQPDEVVRLTEGTISLEVARLHPGERFRVVVGDGEVEVRGTAFDVVAHADHLLAVRVAHGRVEVRPQRGAPIVLGNGQTWKSQASDAGVPRAAADLPATTPATTMPATSATTTASAASAGVPRELAHTPARPIPPTGLRPAAQRRSTHAGTGMTPAELAFERAWASLRAGDAATAAVQLEQALAADPDPGLEEAAAYWRAVALARAGRAAEAAQALNRFLARHADSPRAGEASAMLGWMLLKAGDTAGARRRFTAALSDAVPEVRASARAGIKAADAPDHRARSVPQGVTPEF